MKDPPAAAAPAIVIVGAGIAGLCMAIRLLAAGIRSFTVLEKSTDVGGTWRENTYPGSGCDVPSHLYSFSFEPNPDFSRKYSGQEEILAYLRHCAEKYGVLPFVRFGVEVRGAEWDETRRRWTVRTTSGEELVADVLVSGVGQLNRPLTPRFDGLDSFRGHAFHSAEYRHDAAVRGRRVAVVGSGASAIQLVPKLATEAAQLSVFQRTPNWIVGRGDRTYRDVERWAFRRMPRLLAAYRGLVYLGHEARFLGLRRDTYISRRAEEAARSGMEAHVSSPELRRKLTPDYPIGCRRILISDDFYPALVRPNVTLVTDAIRRFLPDGLETADGAHHALDTVVFATGFQATSFLAPMEIAGRGGILLSDAWRDGAEAYYGVAVPRFPNLFLLYGPNTNLGHNSIIFMIECQVRYLMRCLDRITRERSVLEVLPEAMADFNARLVRDLERLAWGGGCTSWYKTASGKVTNNWSGFTTEYWWRTRKPDFSAFLERPGRGQ